MMGINLMQNILKKVPMVRQEHTSEEDKEEGSYNFVINRRGIYLMI